MEDVYYECGRKIMVVSALADYYCREDAWIEGIGSPSGFWGAYEVAATDGVNRNTSLAQVFASDKSVLYYKGQVINPDYQSTFLRPGKTWEIQTPSNSIDKISIGEPRMINGYPSYPVYKGTYHYDGGYLYDVNGTIYWLLVAIMMIYWIVINIFIHLIFPKLIAYIFVYPIMSIWYTMFLRRMNLIRLPGQIGYSAWENR